MVPCFSSEHEQYKDRRPLPRSGSVINTRQTEGLLIACFFFFFFLFPSSQSFHLPASVNTRLTDEQLRELTTGLNSIA